MPRFPADRRLFHPPPRREATAYLLALKRDVV
jgi:hypothetical protein